MTTDRTRRSHNALERAAVYKIHPAIGFARVGNSPSEYFVASGGNTPDSAFSYRDGGDREQLRLPGIKREAAEFRVYAYDSRDNCIGEVTADSRCSVEWSVSLANKKASGPKTGGSDDRPTRVFSRVRNSQVPLQERWRLEIRPQPRHLTGCGAVAVFDDGRFMGERVCLGEVRTDSAGRLLVLGGSGHAGTYDAAKRISSRTDNDYWFDDTSDGPVQATVALPDGRRIAAEPAWVIVTPPNFAPGIGGVSTQFDVLLDRASHTGSRALPGRPSFRDDILPLLRRICALQWIDGNAVVGFANTADGLDLTSMLPSLAHNDDRTRFAREAVLAAIAKQQALPPADRWLHLTRTQFAQLEFWAAGEFLADWPRAPATANPDGADLTPQQLDRRSLESCAASTFLVDRGNIFVRGDRFRIDHSKVAAGDLTQALPCPWHADFLEERSRWALVARPRDVLTPALYRQLRELDARLAAMGDDHGSEDVQLLRQRRHDLSSVRERWARGLPEEFPARAEAFVKEWQHLGFVTADANAGRDENPAAIAYVERERCPYLGSPAEYFHRLVNFEDNLDFAPKALEIAIQMLGDAKFTAEENYAPFRYTPSAFDERLDRIYSERVRDVMYSPLPWESGKILWSAVADYDNDGEPVWKRRSFEIGRFSDAALRERFRQFAPENLTDGAWLQNVVAAAPMNGVQSRLASIWMDEAGGGRIELNHANVYVSLLQSLKIYLPPVTSREFIEQDFVSSAFLSPVFQFSVGRFPKRFLPELLGMTLFMEWEATPISTAIANMLVERHMDPQYYRMHAGIDNINAGHGALAREAVKLYLDAKLQEGGDAIVQEHWQRIWRGYVAWATLGNGHDEVVERMMLIDKKQIHLGSSLLASRDILPSFLRALKNSDDPVPKHLRSRLGSEARAMIAAWNANDDPPEALVEIVRDELNLCLREGIYDQERFAGIQLSADTVALQHSQVHGRAEFVDFGRSLLEDAYPDGIARRSAFPAVQRYYAEKMKLLIDRKAAVAKASHRRVGWLSDAFRHGAQAVMDAMLKRGFIDLDQPRSSRLFGKTEFGGPMFKVFSEDDERTIIEWAESLRAERSPVIRAQPIKSAIPANGAVNRRSPGRAKSLPETVRRRAPEPALLELEAELGSGSIH